MIKSFEKRKFIFIDKFEYADNVYTLSFNYRNKIILIDVNVCIENENFSYYDYCEYQNSVVEEHKEIYRFLFQNDFEKIVAEIDLFLNISIDEYKCEDNGGVFQKIHIDNTPLEHRFEEVLSKSYGSDVINFISKEEPISLNEGRMAFVDYVINTKDSMLAFEENGVNYHHPMIIKEEKYLKQLEKQNTLNLLGYTVYRFSTESMMMEAQMVSNLQRYIGYKENIIPKKTIKLDRKFNLYEHQIDILSKLDEDRKKGVTTGLIILPTGSGKSQIIIEDLNKNYIKKEVNKILIMVPTTKVKEDWEKRLTNKNVDIFCYNKVYKSTYNISKDYYDYIVFDEAHHAVAANCRKSLHYFTPKYLLGLTATPDRLDNKKLDEVFGEYESTLSLEEAIEKDIICNIRCFRLISNLNLSEVRFNGVDYNYSDLEKTLTIDSRNDLIAQTLKQYYSPNKSFYKQGLIFCVNQKHAIKMSEMLKSYGLTSEAVYGGNKDNDKNFKKYKDKKVQFLCSCQMISEGFDSPQTEVVVMARPTLSKVLYLQQIGRGTRKYPGKESLVVIDVVDNYSASLIPWNFNSLFRINIYHDFIGVKNNTQNYLEIFGLHESMLDLKEIDIFTFEEKFKDLISLESAARELYIGTNTLKNWVKNNNDYCSDIVKVGKKEIPYFNSENIEYIRKDKKLSIHNDDTILDDFINFIDENTLTFSYKLIFLKSVFEVVYKNGNINIDELLLKYKQFYLNRIEKNLKVDKSNCPYNKVYLNNNKLIKKSLLENPFEKFERKRFFYYSKDLNIISFNDSLWNKLNTDIIQNINNKLENFILEYYDKLED